MADSNIFKKTTFSCPNKSCIEFGFIWNKETFGNLCPNCRKIGIFWGEEEEQLKRQIDALYWELERRREKIKEELSEKEKLIYKKLNE